MTENRDSSNTLLYTTLTLNSTTLFTSESPLLPSLGLFTLNENIGSQMAIINASSTPMGQIPLEINGVSIVLMYVKESVEGDIITVVTATDVSAGKILPLTTIQRLLEEWKLFKKEEDARTIQFKVIFNHIIKEVENEYSRSGLELSREELQRTREVMENNIEQVVERNERIGLLVDKTDRLTELSNGFRGSAVRVKRSMWWQNVKFWVMLVIVVLLILVILMKAIA